MPRASDLIFLAMLLFPGPLFAGDLVLHSGPQQVHLLELFTSEGCSSCPPAEERLSALGKDPGLWKTVVPVAFHVDYWDRLGWPDPFASPAYTERQEAYARAWGGDSVYTPEFVLDGREFRGQEPPTPQGHAGNLKVTLNTSRDLAVRFESTQTAAWEAHIALLGAGLETEVRAGENAGRRLRQDFVVLALISLPLRAGTNVGSLTLPSPKDGERAIAVWITESGGFTPVQAVGGWTR